MMPVTERGTDSVAIAALASPVWLPSLQQWSEVAGLLLPIAGLAWLVIQIVTHVLRQRKER